MKLLFIITKGLEKAGSAIRAMQIAALAADRGNHVEIVLMDEAVHWARGIKAENKGLRDYLDMLYKEGNRVLVCKGCADKRLITQQDLIGGTVLATMPTLVEKIASPDNKVITF